MNSTTIRLGRVFLFGLFSLPFLLPRHTPPYPSFYNEWLAALLAVGLIFTFALRPADGKLYLPSIALFPFAILILLCIQLAFNTSAYSGPVLLALLYVFCATLLAIVSRTWLASANLESTMSLIASATLVGGFFNAIAGILQYWEAYGFLSPLIAAKTTPAAYGNLAQSNHFANYTALAVAALIYLAIKRKLSPWLGASLGLVLLLGMALSGSRSAWLYLTALTVAAVILRLQSNSPEARSFIVITFITLLMFAFIQVILPYFAPKAIVASSRIASEDLLNVRWDLWASALAIFADNPWQGVGYHRFAWAHFMHTAEHGSTLHDPTLSPDFVHNLPLQLLAEFGLAGAIISGFVGYWLYRSYRRIDSTEHWLLMAMISILVIHSLLEYPLNYMYFLAPAAILVALADHRSIILRLPQYPLRLLTSTTLIVGCLMLIALFVNQQALEAAYLRIGKSGKISNIQDMQLLALAQRYGPFFEPEIDNIFNAMRIDTQQPEKWQILLDVSTRSIGYKMTASRLYRHILLLTLNGETKTATHLLDKAKKVYPAFYSKQFDTQLSLVRRDLPEHKGLLYLQENSRP